MMSEMLHSRRDREADPLAAAMTGGSSSSTDLGGGVRGCAARNTYLGHLAKNHPEIICGINARLAVLLQKEIENLEPADMRQYLERLCPLGQFKALTYFGYLLAKLWEMCERSRKKYEEMARRGKVPEDVDVLRKDLEALQSMIGMGLVFTDQTCVDQGKYRRRRLMTGLPESLFQLAVKNRKTQTTPYSQLADEMWLAVNIA